MVDHAVECECKLAHPVFGAFLDPGVEEKLLYENFISWDGDWGPIVVDIWADKRIWRREECSKLRIRSH